MTEQRPKLDGGAQPQSAPEARGIECPSCGCRYFSVLYTRRSIGGRILRRRECRNCGRRVTTYEKVETAVRAGSRA